MDKIGAGTGGKTRSMISGRGSIFPAGITWMTRKKSSTSSGVSVHHLPIAPKVKKKSENNKVEPRLIDPAKFCSVISSRSAMVLLEEGLDDDSENVDFVRVSLLFSNDDK